MQCTWCDVCRGAGDLFKCSTCPKKYHQECVKLPWRPTEAWSCHTCETAEPLDKAEKKREKDLRSRRAAVKKAHRFLKSFRRGFILRERSRLLPFVDEQTQDKILRQLPTLSQAELDSVPSAQVSPAGEPYIHAQLRAYQVVGINWILTQYQQGVGGILADEMGLGKTIQTLSFLATLKEKQASPGPHLVITPLAVLQNWCNEMKRFTPGLTFCKVQGNMAERDRILTDPAVLAGEFDVYLTTYETVMSEESFFADNFLWHTITIDEGHRIKNEHSKLCGALSRLQSPFRLLLTGTPLQNNMHELYALLCYIAPDLFTDSQAFESGFSSSQGGREVNRAVLKAAREMLEALMLRRIKAEVETALLPKVEYKVYVPLSSMQRRWYQRLLEKEEGTAELLSGAQLVHKLMQLRKVCNHPKQLLMSYDLRRQKAAARLKAAAGSDFAHLLVEKEMSAVLSQHGAAMETELRSLTGQALLASSGKLALLDRLLVRLQREGSRVLLFSQWTQTLDVLQEYVEWRFGKVNEAYLRLDGSTNRIARELDVRTFNAKDSHIFVYLISTKAGGQGINLATADTVVLYDSCWNPQVDLQAQDRAHRIGQQKQVRVFRLVTEKTSEERILARAEHKMFLDAMVVKKQTAEIKAQLDQELPGGNLHLADVAVGDDGTIDDVDGDEAEKEEGSLSVTELLNILTYGAGAIFKSNSQAGGADSEMSVADLDRRVNSILGVAAEGANVGIASGSTAEEQPLVPLYRSTPPDPCAHPQIKYDGMVPPAEPDGGQRPPGANSEAYMQSGGGDLRGSIFEQAAAFVTAPEGLAVPAGDQGRGASIGGEKVALDEAGDGWDAKVAGPSRAAGSRGVRAPKRYTPPSIEKQTVKKIKLRHDDECFNCLDGGDLLECGVCPRVYHLPCAGLTRVPKGQWRCPWHECWGCQRNKSSVGGMLFQCVTCPVAYCFDCCPEEYLKRNEPFTQYKQVLNSRGYSTATSMLFKCRDCTNGPVKARFSKQTELYQPSGLRLDDFYASECAVEVDEEASEKDSDEDAESREEEEESDDGTEVMEVQKKEGTGKQPVGASAVKIQCPVCTGMFMPNPKGGMRKHKRKHKRGHQGGPCPGGGEGSRSSQHRGSATRMQNVLI
ncbi:hypothetical protein CYMTET_17141 [Cymbomonas tetramitiformis]|uniref:Uncharacterized protein n=1 Tax=Cymbomonas tetramitiformis TaxID=36881 RepID=A0AAE0L7L1_9CHLO|nr:hypothetical protein CYMTET_17141 [Cymbomonas tetramitiformis]